MWLWPLLGGRDICGKRRGGDRVTSSFAFSSQGLLGRALLSRVIHVVVPLQDQLGDGHHPVPCRLHEVQHGGERLGRVEGGVMEEDDGAALHLACDPLGDLRGGELLPVQTVASGNL